MPDNQNYIIRECILEAEINVIICLLLMKKNLHQQLKAAAMTREYLIYGIFM